MARTPKSDGPRTSDPRARPSRGRSGKPAPPPAETAAGTPGFGEAPQRGYDPGTPVLPALRASGPLPPRAGDGSISDALNALLAKPAERSDRAREILARQPMMASHPIVAGAAIEFIPHRP
ncbi:MAG: excinuclease ABC subunit UvrB, partial [Verrucomicrobia bacterium]|nr:excinuclease ABC subunit UvrB [Verrucomicrobiota bacterium]